MFFTRTLSRHVDRKGSYIFDVPDFYEASDHRPIVAKIYLTTK